jgi:hypothetical protein
VPAARSNRSCLCRMYPVLASSECNRSRGTSKPTLARSTEDREVQRINFEFPFSWGKWRFNLSQRDIEDLFAERGITVRHESIRRWCIKFKAKYASRLKRKHQGYGSGEVNLAAPYFAMHRFGATAVGEISSASKSKRPPKEPLA